MKQSYLNKKNMIEHIGKKVLITTTDWFYGRDGKQYHAIHGTLKAVHEASKSLGFIPNRAHANWFVEIGNMNIMGCQVLYFEQVDEVNFDMVKDYKVTDGDVKHYERPSDIYKTL